MKKKIVLWTLFPIFILVFLLFPFNSSTVTYRVESDPQLESFLFFFCKTSMRIRAASGPSNGSTLHVDPIFDFTHLRRGSVFTTCFGIPISWKKDSYPNDYDDRAGYVPPSTQRRLAPPPPASGIPRRY
ncbi:MAG TPA: hypothetical protein VGE62_03090 [Candidatus Paceibacterota bacterium]